MLHYNKPKSNYHIHLIFADRDLLKKTQVKYASRNMYYNEQGHHVRTKKEALEAVKRKQAEWDGEELPVEEMTKTQKQKKSVLKQLAEKRAEVAESRLEISKPRIWKYKCKS